MTTVAVLADPPEHAPALDRLEANGVLDAEEAATLYAAALCDACVAVERSGGDLLVNYRTPDSEGDGGGELDDDAAREAVSDALSLAFEDPEALRYEVQVGSTRSARVGNTVTHLLEAEAVKSAAVVDPVVTLLERRHIDSAAMKLRQSEVVLGPTTGGRVWYAAFTEPIDFADAFAPPTLRRVTERGRAEGLDVDFVEALPVLDSPADLASSIAQVRARETAEKFVPPYTAAAFDEIGLDVAADGDGIAVERD